MIKFLMAIATSILPWFSPERRDKAKRTKLDDLQSKKKALVTRSKPSEKRVKQLLKIEKKIKKIESNLINVIVVAVSISLFAGCTTLGFKKEVVPNTMVDEPCVEQPEIWWGQKGEQPDKVWDCFDWIIKSQAVDLD